MPNRPSTSRSFTVTGIAAVTGSTASTVAVSATAACTGHFALALVGAVLPLLAFVAVVCPAVWSRKAARRKAALTVLDRLLGRSGAP